MFGATVSAAMVIKLIGYHICGQVINRVAKKMQILGINKVRVLGSGLHTHSTFLEVPPLSPGPIRPELIPVSVA